MHYFHEHLAIAIGLHESIFIQNIYYLLKRRILEIGFEQNKNLWIKLSATKQLEFQPYFSRSQLRTIGKNLLKLGLIQNEKKHLQYNSNTLSYTLTTKGWAYMIFLDSYENQEKLKETIVKCKHQLWSKETELWLFLARSLAKSDRPLLKVNKDWSFLANIYIEDRYLIEYIETNNNILDILDSTTDINKNSDEDSSDSDDNLDNNNSSNEENKVKNYEKVHEKEVEDNISREDENKSLEKNTFGEGALSPESPLEKGLNSIKTKSSFELEVNRIFESCYEFKRKVLKTFERIEDFKLKVLYPSVRRTSYSDVAKALKKASENFFGYMSPVAEFFAVLEGMK